MFCRGEEFGFESVGARAGVGGSESSRGFNQAEVFVSWKMPGRWLGPDWFLKPRLELCAGWLGESGQDAAVATLDASLVLGYKQFPLTIEAGSGPTAITSHRFATADFGTLFQVTTHAGVNWDWGAHVRMGYRFQHMSNGGLSRHNSGLNMHLFGLSYLF